MRYFSLVWVGLWRSRMRSVLTLLSAVIAFLLFGMLNGIDVYLKQAVDMAHLNVLVSINPGGLTLPIAYLPRLQAVPGVRAVSYRVVLGGYYRMPRNNVAILATDPTSIFHVDDDFQATPSDVAALSQNRIGALVTPWLANKYGWKRGDTVSIHSPAMPQKNGSLDWRFQLVGYLNIPINPEAALLYVNYNYIDLARSANTSTVNQYLMLINDPAQAGTISNTIDNMFVNSPVQTRTMSEKDMAQSQLASIGNIDFFLDAIIAAVFFTLLLLVGNALMQSFRERIREFAVMKTLGFTDGMVAGLVVAEAVLLCVVAAVIGLGAAWFVLPAIGKLASNNAALPHPPTLVFVIGLGLAMLVGLICGAVPAWKVSRLTIVNALAKH